MDFLRFVHPAERAAEALVALRRQRTPRMRLSRRGGSGDLLAVVEHGRTLRSTLQVNELIETLCGGGVAFERDRDALQGPQTPPLRHHAALDRLCWLFGERCAREFGLLRQLAAHRRYRLLAWPDFDAIGGDAQGIALCRLLAREAVSPEAAARQLELPLPLVAGLFNSMALCGVLVAQPKYRPAGRAGPPAAATRFGMLWRRLSG